MNIEKKVEAVSHMKSNGDKLWNTYSMSLIKNITKTEKKYHHQIIPYQNGSLKIKLFGCIYIDICRINYFGSIKIEYQIDAPGMKNIELPPSFINDDGILDNTYSLKDESQVFECYLQKFQIVCDAILLRSAKKGHNPK